jgi:hypothetical protein
MSSVGWRCAPVTPEERAAIKAEVRQELLNEGKLSDQDKTAYTEAGYWVRTCNTVLWTMTFAVGPILIALITAAALKSKIDKWVLVTGSFFIAVAWVYIDWYYEMSANDARATLGQIEGPITLGIRFTNCRTGLCPEFTQ